MKLAFELVPDLATHIAPHHRFYMSILQNGLELPDSCGSDTYLYNALVLPGSPIAATGRDASHNFEPDLKGVKGVDGVGADVPPSNGEASGRLVVRVDNNLILSQEVLQSFYSLRCRIDGHAFLFPLKNPCFRVNWDSLGVFDIEADAVLQTILNKRIA